MKRETAAFEKRASGADSRSAPIPATRLRGSDTESPWEDTVALSVDLARAVEAAAAETLSGVDCLVLLLHYVEGWETDEIAKRVDMSYTQVRRTLKRALKALQETGLLQGYGEQAPGEKR
ncbi:MAG TPA: sigma factor-like helix-turn-helix DNA-binding protein [Armatimonadota bacterium]|nr:sigma factor-like helix-turn-helix DNA-binding protein [Armatimonadota bacterium]